METFISEISTSFFYQIDTFSYREHNHKREFRYMAMSDKKTPTENLFFTDCNTLTYRRENVFIFFSRIENNIYRCSQVIVNFVVWYIYTVRFP